GRGQGEGDGGQGDGDETSDAHVRSSGCERANSAAARTILDLPRAGERGGRAESATLRPRRRDVMKLGLSIGYSGAELKLPVEKILLAEKLGFDSVWTAGGYGSGAMTPLGALSGR